MTETTHQKKYNFEGFKKYLGEQARKQTTVTKGDYLYWVCFHSFLTLVSMGIWLLGYLTYRLWNLKRDFEGSDRPTYVMVEQKVVDADEVESRESEEEEEDGEDRSQYL